MELKKLPYELSVCKIRELCPEILADEFFFLEKTDEELSLVCICLLYTSDAADD